LNYRFVQLEHCKLQTDREHSLGGPGAGQETNGASHYGGMCGISCL